MLAVPVTLLVIYGLLRLSSTLFRRTARYRVRAASPSARCDASHSPCFAICTRLSLRFHLERQTGGVSRDIERGTRGIATLMSFTLFSIIPTILEIALVCGLLLVKFDYWFALITLRRADDLYRHHHRDHRMAHASSPHHERHGLEGQHESD